MDDELLNKISMIINSSVENALILPENLNENLCVLGMDSIDFIHVIVALEEEFDIEIPDEKLLITEMDTTAKIANVILDAIKSAKDGC